MKVVTDVWESESLRGRLQETLNRHSMAFSRLWMKLILLEQIRSWEDLCG